MPGFDLDAVDEQFPIPKEEVESRYEKLCEMLDNETEKQLSNQQETSANLASSVADVNRTGASKEWTSFNFHSFIEIHHRSLKFPVFKKFFEILF